MDLTSSINPSSGTLSILISNTFPISIFQFLVVDANGVSFPTLGLSFDTPNVPEESALIAQGNNPSGTGKRTENLKYKSMASMYRCKYV